MGLLRFLPSHRRGGWGLRWRRCGPPTSPLRRSGDLLRGLGDLGRDGPSLGSPRLNSSRADASSFVAGLLLASVSFLSLNMVVFNKNVF